MTLLVCLSLRVNILQNCKEWTNHFDQDCCSVFTMFITSYKKLNQISDIKCSQILGVLILAGVGWCQHTTSRQQPGKVLDIKTNTWLQTNKKCKVALKIFLVSNKIQALYSHFKFHFILHFYSHCSNFVVKFTSDGNREENYFHFDARVGFRI